MEQYLPSRRAKPPSRAALIASLYAGLALLAVGIAAVRGDWDLYRLEGRSTPIRLLVSPLIGVLVGLIVVGISRESVHRFAWARRLHRDFRGLLGGLSATDVLVLAVASAIGEELLFRGALLPWIGVWGSTLVFALLHIGPGTRFLPWTVTAFIAGLAFAGLYVWLGDLGAPIVAHFTINYLNLGYIIRVDLPEP